MSNPVAIVIKDFGNNEYVVQVPPDTRLELNQGLYTSGIAVIAANTLKKGDKLRVIITPPEGDK